MLEGFPMEEVKVIGVENGFFTVLTVFSFVFIIPAITKKIIEERLSGIKV